MRVAYDNCKGGLFAYWRPKAAAANLEPPEVLLLRFKPRMGLDDTLAFDFFCGGERLIALCSPPPVAPVESGWDWAEERGRWKDCRGGG